MLKLKSKKLIAICCAAVLAVACVVPAFAASYDTSWSFNSGSNGTCGVYGNNNGIFYTLNPGTAYLSLTDGDTCAIGEYTVSLYINDSWFGLGTKCGNRSFYSAPGSYHSTSFTAPRSDSRYYFVVLGAGYDRNYEAS